MTDKGNGRFNDALVRTYLWQREERRTKQLHEKRKEILCISIEEKSLKECKNDSNWISTYPQEKVRGNHKEREVTKRSSRKLRNEK